MAMESLNHLPVELLEPIFQLACTDGGRTGCALSLTSKHIRAASHSARFHSVSLLSGCMNQLAQFIASYSSLCDNDEARKPRVRHLCLALASGFPGETAEQIRRDKISSDMEGRLQQYREDVITLVNMVSQDVETVCLIDPCPDHCLFSRREELRFSSISIQVAGFPSLTELATVGRVSPDLPRLVPADEARIPLMPRLVTFHSICMLPEIYHAPVELRLPNSLGLHALSLLRTGYAPDVSEAKVVAMDRCGEPCNMLGRLCGDDRIQWSFNDMLAPYCTPQTSRVIPSPPTLSTSPIYTLVGCHAGQHTLVHPGSRSPSPDAPPVDTGHHIIGTSSRKRSKILRL
ncbi:hypothetical protein FKP32DRAFT_1358882 [Trametes sanguinea]|nr:hypothetical protein FKP32DRAFT_1358882 [Trametes sanguinea]